MSEESNDPMANVYGSSSKGPYVFSIISTLIAVLICWLFFSGPSEEDVQRRINTEVSRVSRRVDTKADSISAYANLASKSDIEGLRSEITTLSNNVNEVSNEVLGFIEVTGDDSSGYELKYTPGLSDLIRGRRDTVEVMHGSDTLRTAVRIVAMPSGAEMQQAINHDLPRVMAATWSGGLPTPEALAFAQTYRREVGLNTSTARSNAKFAEDFQRARPAAGATP